MDDQAHSTEPERGPRGALDLRRAIPRHVWLANRARNALGRPTFIVAITIGTFVTAVMSIAIAARSRGEPAVVAPAPRPDTLTLLAAQATAQLDSAQADSALGAARRLADSLRAAPFTIVEDPSGRDSLISRLHVLEELMARAEQAPLASSYRALASSRELRDDARVAPIVDTLTQIERSRDSMVSAGGVTPDYMELSARVNLLGRTLQALGLEHRNGIVAELSALGPTQPAAAQLPDTAALVANRDTAQATLRETAYELEKRRAIARQLDRDEAGARERASAVAPTHALLGAAFVFSAVIGFAVAFVGELRRPRVSNASELERHLGVRVLSNAPTPVMSPDRGRRAADRSAPPHFDPGAEGYQLAYLALATDHPTMLMATITGDDPNIAAVVGCNLAAIAADEARNALVLNLDPSGAASAALRARTEPGITDVVLHDTPWPAATTVARAGRDRVVELVPYGSARGPVDPTRVSEVLARDSSRLARYYDATILIVRPEDLISGLARSLPSPEFIYCVRPGVTPLRQLREHLDAARAAGAVVRGLIVWDAVEPELEAPPSPAQRLPYPRSREPQPSTV